MAALGQDDGGDHLGVVRHCQPAHPRALVFVQKAYRRLVVAFEEGKVRHAPARGLTHTHTHIMSLHVSTQMYIEHIATQGDIWHTIASMRKTRRAGLCAQHSIHAETSELPALASSSYIC